MRNLAERMQKSLKRARVAVYGILMPVGLGLTLSSLSGVAVGVWRIAYVLFGFSLIIFLHELGHFLVARACGVKCLAFSLGIGPRMFGWRKGSQVTYGADPFDPEIQEKKRAKAKKLEEAEAGVVRSDLPTTAEDPPHRPNVGDTDYRLSWLPLGGYVRMLGQDDMDPTKVSSDPRAFNMRPIWQRMCIVSAGVTMNIIFAIVTFSILFSPGLGIAFPPAQVGTVEYNSPAWKAGIRMGDRIVAVDGERPTRGFLEFTDVKLANALSSGERAIPYIFEQPGVPGEKKVAIRPVIGDDNFLGIGISPMPGLKIVQSASKLQDEIDVRAKSKKEGGTGELAAAKEIAKLHPGDTITTINGKPIQSYPEMFAIEQAVGPHPVTVVLDRAKGGSESITLAPELHLTPGVDEFPSLFGMGPALRIDLVSENSGAQQAKMEAGDIVEQIGERIRPTISEFRRITRESGGQTLKVVVRRGEKILPLDVKISGSPGKGLMGVAPVMAFDDMTVVVRDRSAAGLPPELQSGGREMRLVKVDGKPVASWDEVVWLVKQKKAGEQVAFSFAPVSVATQPSASQPAAASEVTGHFTVTQPLLTKLQDQLSFLLMVPVELKNEVQRAQSFPGAVMMGLDHTKKFVEQVYMTLSGLVHQTVSASNLHGMIGISRVGYQVQERGQAWFWYLMAIVSVNLAVANFLPLPIVDGGLFLLLILEKIRGKPLSLKVQSAIQVVGIVVLAGLFLFVTYNDIFKMP